MTSLSRDNPIIEHIHIMKDEEEANEPAVRVEEECQRCREVQRETNLQRMRTLLAAPFVFAFVLFPFGLGPFLLLYYFFRHGDMVEAKETYLIVGKRVQARLVKVKKYWKSTLQMDDPDRDCLYQTKWWTVGQLDKVKSTESLYYLPSHGVQYACRLEPGSEIDKTSFCVIGVISWYLCSTYFCVLCYWMVPEARLPVYAVFLIGAAIQVPLGILGFFWMYGFGCVCVRKKSPVYFASRWKAVCPTHDRLPTIEGVAELRSG